MSTDPRRPYLVVPKLIDQPTWGGQYIVENKGWTHHANLANAKIGQSYELFSGSNLSLLDSSENPAFVGEFTDRDAVQMQTDLPNAISLDELIDANSAKAILGAEVVAARGPRLELLIKFTQALGNSFQVHIKAGVKDPVWKPKPESWYFFEPGLITLGVKPDADWAAYEEAVTAVEHAMTEIGRQIAAGELAYEDAQPKVQALLKEHDPWQYVNLVRTAKDELIDLSGGGLHHSWEEDPKAPLGNVLYELQAEAMDDISTFRNFDKGKVGQHGEIRDLHISEYYKHIDRDPAANDPASHVVKARAIAHTDTYRLDRLLETPLYNLDKLSFSHSGATFTEDPGRYKHLFVKTGKITVMAGSHTITVGTGHSGFVPAAAGEYEVTCLAGPAEVLISF
ncbi:MAG TPA: hypothetical protein VHQ86_01265 [Candidatus Saccharimonadia bacterium]|jgi:hypothetical protein|nr:hypothetical protein [Candidatus Saccharimonadia bacterium]